MDTADSLSQVRLFTADRASIESQPLTLSMSRFQAAYSLSGLPRPDQCLPQRLLLARILVPFYTWQRQQPARIYHLSGAHR